MSLICPKCKSTNKFYISARSDVEVDGKTEYVNDHEGFYWDDDSICCCTECQFEQSVDKFRKGVNNGKFSS